MTAAQHTTTSPAPRTARPLPIADLRSQALAMLDAGFSIIPIFDKLPYDPTKKPYQDKKTGKWVARPRLSWEPYQRERPSHETVKQWFNTALPLDRQPNGIGLLSGTVSGGVCVLDFETVARFTAWREQVTPAVYAQLCIVRTGRGYHVIFKCPTPRTGHADLIEGKAPVEVRGDDLYIAAVNSWHPDARRRYTLEQGSLCTLTQLAQADADRLILLAIPTLDLTTAQPTPVARTTTSTPPPKPKQTPNEWMATHTGDNLTAADIRTAYNQRFDVRDLIVSYGGSLDHGRLYHCPCTAAHANGDSHGSLLVSTSTKSEKYGAYICGCYNSACPLFTGNGKVIAAFDLMQIMEGHSADQAVYEAFKQLGITRERTTAPTPLPKALPVGRPRKLTDMEYRKRAAQLADGRDEHGNPRTLLSCAELAAKLDISPSTARRIEKRLKGRLLWDRQQCGRCGSMATVLPGVAQSRAVKTPKSDDSRTSKTPEITPSSETAFSASQSAETENAEIALKACDFFSSEPSPAPIVGTTDPTHTQKSHASPEAPGPTLGEMVREALDANGDGLKRRHMRTRATQTARYIEANFGCVVDPARLVPVIRREQDRRKYAAAAAQLETLEPWQLKDQQRCYQGRIDRAMKDGKDKQARLWLACLRNVDAEFKRRGLDPTVNYRKPRKVRPNAPTLRTFSQLELEARQKLAALPATPAVVAQEPPNVSKQPHSVSQDVKRWRAALEARLEAPEPDDEDTRLEKLAMSFANSFMWESAHDRIAQMQDRAWARQLHGVVRDMLRLTGLPGYDPRIPRPNTSNVPSGAVEKV